MTALGPVAVLGTSDLVALTVLVHGDARLSSGDVELRTATAEALAREISRAASSGAGVVAVARDAAEVPRLRAAGADEIVVVASPGPDVAATVARAVIDARERAVLRNRRVDRLRGLMEDVDAGRAEPNVLLAGIVTELLERPGKLLATSRFWLSGAAASQSSGDAEAIASLRESLYVIERVHELAASTREAARSGALCDIEAVARQVTPMLSVAFGQGVDVRVVPRRGPHRTPVSAWRVATAILAAAVALACSSADRTEEPDEPASKPPASEPDSEHPRLRASSPFHISTNPPPGRAAVTIGLLGMGDLVRLYVTTDLADPDDLPLGSITVRDRDSASNPAHAALLLAALCVNPWDGFVDVSPGADGGASISIFVPADGPPLDGS